jgi:hypothetical protein
MPLPSQRTLQRAAPDSTRAVALEETWSMERGGLPAEVSQWTAPLQATVGC